MSVWKTNDHETKRVLYVQTHGEKDPERTATPFFLATAALGSYYGKVRVSVNGTFKWLALYN